MNTDQEQNWRAKNLLKVGLTGGIGCGKSTAVDAFHELGINIIDADQIAKDIVKPGQKALSEIAEKFGDEILLENGELNRPLLKEKVFKEPKALELLENILHPQIRLEIVQQINRHKKGDPYIIVDVPLLVEKNYQQMFDRIIVVDCLPEQQLERVRQRDNISESQIKKIMQTQVSRDQRNNHATDILDNSADKEFLLKQINALHQKFLGLSQG